MEKDLRTSQASFSGARSAENPTYSSRMTDRIIFIRFFCSKNEKGKMTNPIMIILLELVALVIPIQLGTFLGLTQGFYTFAQMEQRFKDFEQIFGIVQNILLIILILKMMILGYLFLAKDTKGLLFVKILRWTGSDMISDKVILSIAAAVLMWFDGTVGVSIFITGSVMAVINGILLKNYVNMYDISYNTSISTSTVDLGFKICSYFLNFLFFSTRSKVSLYVNSMVMLLYGIWYLKIGFKKYIYPVPMWCTNIYSAACISTTFVLISSELLTQPHPNFMSHIVEILVLFALCLLFLAVTCKIQLKMKSREFGREQIKTLEFILCTDQNCCDINSNKTSQLLVLGLLKYHSASQCPNPRCFTAKGSIKFEQDESDSLKLSNGSAQNTLKFKLLIKCLYERLLQRDPRNTDVMIDYLQFLYNQLKSEYLSCSLNLMRRTEPVGYFDKIKVELIFELLRYRRRKLNQQLYDHKMEIQSILDATDHFDKTIVDIRRYLKGQKEIWSYLKSKQINFWHLRQKSKQLFKYLDDINATWQELVHYFPINKLWRFSYLFTMVFLNNRRPSRKEVDEIINCQIWIQSVKNVPIFLDSFSSPSDYIRAELIFHFQSFYLHAVESDNQLLIKNVSKNVEEATGYTKQEILNCNVQMLMPEELRKNHEQLLKEWLNRGVSSEEEAFKIKKTLMICKEGEVKNVIKYFKILINSKNQLEYVCLLKINEEKYIEDLSKNEAVVLDDCEKGPLLPQSSQTTTKMDRLKIQRETSMSSDMQLQQYLKKYSKVEDNQFIKQDSFATKHKDSDVSVIIWILRILTGFMLIFIPTTMTVLNNSLEDSIAYSSRYFSFMATYRIPMILGNNYYKHILQIGDQTNVVSQIHLLSNQMRQTLAKPEVIRTIYDRVINQPKLYYPFSANSYNQNMSYTQVDLFYVMSSSIATLENLPIDRRGRQFNVFMSYIKPSYDNLINGTKNNFHQQFQISLQQISIRQIVFIAVYSFVVVAIIVVTLYKIKAFLVRLQTIMEVFAETRDEYQRKVFQYWQELDVQFKDFSANQCNLTYLATPNQIQDEVEEENKNNTVIMNHRTKEFVEDNNVHKIKIKILVPFLIGIFVISSAKLGITISNIQKIQELKVFEEDGWAFLKYFPTATIVGLGCMEKLDSQLYPNQTTFYPQRYADVLASMKLVKDFQYISKAQEQASQYYTVRRNYFFGNPCSFNPKVLDNIGITVRNCESLIDESFTRGLTSYMKTGQILAESYIQGRTNLTKAKLDEFSLSVAVLSGYVLDAIVVWGNQFNERVASMKKMGMIETILLSVSIVVIHLVLFEWFLFKLLLKEYNFYRRIYNNMIPQSLLENEKIVLQKLINEGLIVSAK